MSDALKRLIEAVEKGTAANPRRKGAHDMELFFDAFPPHLVKHEYQFAYDAFKGSLDAAKALHDALLPGWWQQQRISTRTRVQVGNVAEMPWCYDDIPARAWLIAVLRAYQQVQA